jgi:transposase
MVVTLLLYTITPFELKTRANDNKEKLQEEYRETTAENDSHHFAIPSFPRTNGTVLKPHEG